MSTTWHLYELSTGRFTGRTFSGPPRALPLNTPDSCGAYAAQPGEEVDHRRQRVIELQSDHGDLVLALHPCTPPEPAATEWAAPVWSEPLQDWLMQPTLAALKRDAAAAVLERLATLDQRAIRPVGEIAQAQALGDAPPAAALRRLQAVNADKATLRQLLTAINAAASADELAGLPIPTLTTEIA